MTKTLNIAAGVGWRWPHTKNRRRRRWERVLSPWFQWNQRVLTEFDDVVSFFFYCERSILLCDFVWKWRLLMHFGCNLDCVFDTRGTRALNKVLWFLFAISQFLILPFASLVLVVIVIATSTKTSKTIFSWILCASNIGHKNIWAYSIPITIFSILLRHSRWLLVNFFGKLQPHHRPRKRLWIIWMNWIHWRHKGVCTECPLSNVWYVSSMWLGNVRILLTSE